MSIRYQHQEMIAVPAEEAFAVIDNLPLTAKWLPPCVSLSADNDGNNAVGDQLHYVFKQGSQEAQMAGEIRAREVNQRLHCVYRDKMFEVSVDLRVDDHPAGCMTTHTIEITPQTLLARLMWPMIRLGLGRQTRQAAANLKALLESGSG